MESTPANTAASGTAAPATAKPLSKNEELKVASRYLRGTILEGLADTSTGAIAEEDTQLLKFHGSYMQDDRDLRNERRRQKLEKAYIFMVRVRLPAGVCSPKQWLEMDRLSDTYANGTLKLTTRQTFQFHGILKQNLRAHIQGINAALLDTLATCGDVNRNVMCNPNPHISGVHARILELSREISEHLLPRTTAYHEIWLGGERVAGGDTEGEDNEPLYGKTYLPRKFKIAIAVPPSNDIDIFAQDLGFIAVLDAAGKLVGFNVTVGGGMGMSHGKAETFPRLADVMGFCTPEQVVDVAEKVMLVQRDYGDRTDRKHARLKYTIEDRGLAWFRGEVEARLGYKLQQERPYAFTDTGDRYGWTQGADGKWHLTLFIQNGRVKDVPGSPVKTGLRELAKIHKGEFRLTANQNLIVACIAPEDRPAIEAVLKQYKLDTANQGTGLRLNSMACVALPTCGLALAESERYLPDLVTALDKILEDAGLRNDAIVIRMTGCPNGCARPYLAEIGLVGRVPGKYNLYLGASFNGTRLNRLYKETLTHDEILAELTPMIHRFAKERKPGEHFGDFVIRAGYIAAMERGSDFNK